MAIFWIWAKKNNNKQKFKIVDPTKLSWFDRKINKPNNEDVLRITSSIRKMLAWGIIPQEALKQVRMVEKKNSVRVMLYEMILGIEAGQTIPDVFKDHVDVFGKSYCASLEAGYTSGRLENMLMKLENQLELKIRVSKESKSAAKMPMFVWVFAIIVFIGMLLFLFPAFANVFKEINAPIPPITAFFLALSDTLVSYWFIIFPVILTLILILYFFFNKTQKWIYIRDGAMLTLPIAKPLTRHSTLAMLFDTMSLMNEAGIPADEAFKIIIDSVDNVYFKEMLKRVGDYIISWEWNYYEAFVVAQWIDIPTNYNEQMILPKPTNYLIPLEWLVFIKVGEDTGSLLDAYKTIAEGEKNELLLFTKELPKQVETLAFIAIWILVWTIVMSIYLPMFSLWGSFN